MPGDKAEVVMFGPKPIIEEALTKAGLQLHKAWAAPDHDAFVASIAPRVRAIAAVAGHGPVDSAIMSRFPKLEIVSSFGVGYDHIDAKWAGEHGVIVTNTPDVLNEEVADTALGLLLCTVRHLPQAERYLRAGQLAEARRLSAHALAARPHRRHRRHGTHRQGDRTPARRHEGAGRLSLAPARRGRALPALSEPRRDGARRRRADRHHARRRRDAESRSMPRCSRRSGPNGILINMARGSVVDEAGADQGAARARPSCPPASTCSPTSRRCRRN